MVTDHMDIMDTTDHTDTGDTMARDLLMRLPPPLDLTQMLKLILIMDTDMATTDHTDITEDTMARDLLMRLQLLDQMLILRPMLMLGMDTMVTDLGDTLDTTDHTDTGDTMAKDLLMRLPLPLDLTQMLKLIHITDMAMATTDHMDITEDTMARDPLMTKLLLLVQTLMLMLMLMLGMDTMDALTMDMDMDIGERSKSISTIRKHYHLFFEKMHWVLVDNK